MQVPFRVFQQFVYNQKSKQANRTPQMSVPNIAPAMSPPPQQDVSPASIIPATFWVYLCSLRFDHFYFIFTHLLHFIADRYCSAWCVESRFLLHCQQNTMINVVIAMQLLAAAEVFKECLPSLIFFRRIYLVCSHRIW